MPFTPRHLTQRYVGWLNDPEVVRYSEQRHRLHTLDSCRSYFASFEGSDSHFLAIEAADEALGHIGNITVSVDRHNQMADLSIMIGEKTAWGGGFATAAWCAVMEDQLGRAGLRKITAGTMSVNTSMVKLMERSGMTIEARRARHFLYEGIEVDLVQAARFQS
jgi:RimJ/RimL family protein N-acetyltransferase